MLEKALALHRKGQLSDAAALYRKILTQNPRNADALHLLGVIETQRKNLLAAIKLFDRAIELSPKNAAFFSNRGTALKELNRLDEALASFDRALAIRPDYAEALNNRGIVLEDLNRIDEALSNYDRALAIKPDYADALNNRGIALRELKRVDEALTSYDQALAIKPDYADARYNRGLAQLLCGDYRNGFAGYEWRWAAANFPTRPPKIGAPKWQGENLAGRSILVFHEQGLGDAIQFARYLPLLIQRGAKVSFFCPAKLVRLLRPLSTQIEFVPSLTGQETFDFQCALMSLPLRLGADLESIPRRIPYLEAEADLAGAWKQTIGNVGFKIGIAWQGKPDGKIDRGRSLPLCELIPFARRPGIRLISLQKTHGLDQLTNLPADATVETLGDGFDSGPDAFVDTAAVMSTLDLIVTSDTSIAHLAGALGRPTWVALQHVPDWRWLLDRGDSPWYPAMRLFRQQTRGDWSTVFRDMAGELDALLARPRRANTPVVGTS